MATLLRADGSDNLPHQAAVGLELLTELGGRGLVTGALRGLR